MCHLKNINRYSSLNIFNINLYTIYMNVSPEIIVILNYFSFDKLVNYYDQSS